MDFTVIWLRLKWPSGLTFWPLQVGSGVLHIGLNFSSCKSMGLNIRLETLPETVVLFGLKFVAGGKTRYVVTPYFFRFSWALTKKRVLQKNNIYLYKQNSFIRRVVTPTTLPKHMLYPHAWTNVTPTPDSGQDGSAFLSSPFSGGLYPGSPSGKIKGLDQIFFFIMDTSAQILSFGLDQQKSCVYPPTIMVT